MVVEVGRGGVEWGLIAQELSESRGSRPGLPIHNSPCGLCGPKATLNCLRARELCESRGGRSGFPVHNSPCGLCGPKITLNLTEHLLGFRSPTVPLRGQLGVRQTSSDKPCVLLRFS